MLKDILLTFLGFCGALCVAKMQERDSAMMQIKFQLIDELIAIDERLHADFAKGEISHEFHRLTRRFELHLRAYCKARRLHFFKNRELLKAWEKFISLARVAKPTSPKKAYGIIREDSPKDCGLEQLIHNVFQLLY